MKQLQTRHCSVRGGYMKNTPFLLSAAFVSWGGQVPSGHGARQGYGLGSYEPGAVAKASSLGGMWSGTSRTSRKKGRWCVHVRVWVCECVCVRECVAGYVWMRGFASEEVFVWVYNSVNTCVCFSVCGYLWQCVWTCPCRSEGVCLWECAGLCVGVGMCLCECARGATLDWGGGQGPRRKGVSWGLLSIPGSPETVQPTDKRSALSLLFQYRRAPQIHGFHHPNMAGTSRSSSDTDQGVIVAGHYVTTPTSPRPHILARGIFSSPLISRGAGTAQGIWRDTTFMQLSLEYDCLFYYYCC